MKISTLTTIKQCVHRCSSHLDLWFYFIVLFDVGYSLTVPMLETDGKVEEGERYGKCGYC